MRQDHLKDKTHGVFCEFHDLTSIMKVSSRSTDMVGDRLSNV